MKNIFFICMFATVAFTGCVDDDDDLLTGEVSPGVEILPENKPNEVVDSKLFEIINLDYPGLQKVKKFYENGEYYYAANELLEYYRTRVDVNNPNVNLINPTISEKDQRIADQALEHRFYVKGFAESVDEVTKLETYYSFYDASAKKIDWNANEDKQKKEQNSDTNFIAINGCFPKQKHTVLVKMKNISNHGLKHMAVGSKHSHILPEPYSHQLAVPKMM